MLHGTSRCISSTLGSLCYSSRNSFFRASIRLYSTSGDVVDEADEFFKEMPTVYTTGICTRTSSGSMLARVGTYWGRNDALNSYQPFTSGKVNIARVQIEAVAFALKQALYEKKLDSIIVKTDSQFVEKVANRYLQNWRLNNYHKSDGSPVKNREDIEELDRLLQSIHADIQYVDFDNAGENILLSYLKEEGVMNEDMAQLKLNSKYAPPTELSNYKASEEGEDNTPASIVYVTGSHAKSGKVGEFYVAGYGIHWADKPNQDRCERFCEMPITLYRAQLTGIISAMEEAIEKGLRRVEIATDSSIFLAHYKANWLKLNGDPIANYPFYKRIVQLAEKIEVKFKYVPEALNDLEMEKAKQLAVDGMAYPIVKKSIANQFPDELMRPQRTTATN